MPRRWRYATTHSRDTPRTETLEGSRSSLERIRLPLVTKSPVPAGVSGSHTAAGLAPGAMSLLGDNCSGSRHPRIEKIQLRIDCAVHFRLARQFSRRAPSAEG